MRIITIMYIAPSGIIGFSPGIFIMQLYANLECDCNHSFNINTSYWIYIFNTFLNRDNLRIEYE